MSLTTRHISAPGKYTTLCGTPVAPGEPRTASTGYYLKHSHRFSDWCAKCLERVDMGDPRIHGARGMMVHRVGEGGRPLCGAPGAPTGPEHTRGTPDPSWVPCAPCEARQALLDLSTADLGDGLQCALCLGILTGNKCFTVRGQYRCTPCYFDRQPWIPEYAHTED